MSKKRKSQSLPLNTIIIAILVLIVLVVIVLIFTGKMGFFNKSIQDCENKGGIESTTPEKEGYACYKIEENKYCCIQIDKQA